MHHAVNVALHDGADGAVVQVAVLAGSDAATLVVDASGAAVQVPAALQLLDRFASAVCDESAVDVRVAGGITRARSQVAQVEVRPGGVRVRVQLPTGVGKDATTIWHQRTLRAAAKVASVPSSQ
jgi:lipase chaperone LimK